MAGFISMVGMAMNKKTLFAKDNFERLRFGALGARPMAA